MVKAPDPFRFLKKRKIAYTILLVLAGAKWSDWKEFHKENMEADIDEDMLQLGFKFSKHIYFGDECGGEVPSKAKYFYVTSLDYEPVIFFSDIKNFQDYIEWDV